MNILVDGYKRDDRSYNEDGKIVLDWFWHHAKHPYKGFSVTFTFLWWVVGVIFIDSRDKYEEAHRSWAPNRKVSGFWLFPRWRKPCK